MHLRINQRIVLEVNFMLDLSAIHAVVTSIGPVIGLFIGGFLLTIYTDFDRVDISKYV